MTEGAGISGQLAEPDYWLITGLERPGGSELAEAAFAVAPGLVPREVLSYDAGQVLGCADLYAARHRVRVVFFSDLTRMFASAGRSWASLGVNWEAALDELHHGAHLSMYLTITERAFVLMCDSAVTHSEPGIDDERELVRQAMAERLVADWPGYVTGLARSGRLRDVG